MGNRFTGGSFNAVYLLFVIFFITLFGILPQSTQASSPRFITTWTTTTPSEQITIPINPAYNTYNYNVDWGDGNTDTGDTTNATHIYAAADTYTVVITGIFPAIYFNAASYAPLITSVEQWGTNHWLSMASAFYGCSNLVINDTRAPDLSGVTNMSSMFYDASSFNQDISSWDVSHVTNMSYMLKDDFLFNQPLNSWDVSNVTNMSGMFVNDDSFNQPLDSWDVSSVTDMSVMFKNDTIPNLDISMWNVSNVTNMFLMFQIGSGGLTTDHYDALLEAWAQEPLQTGITFMAGASKYCPSAAAARASIISAYSWGILDGGLLSPCTHAVTYSAGAHGAITGDTSQTVDDGDDATEITAVPNSGYHFVNWTGTYTSTDNPLTDIDVTHGIAEIANFARSPQDSGRVIGHIPYGCRDSAALNYNEFSASDPTICQYEKVVTPALTSAHFIFARDLKVGFVGDDVKELQKFLNNNGFPLSETGAGSSGNEITHFGKLTKMALIKFQASKNISPALGFFGPITRGIVNGIIEQ